MGLQHVDPFGEPFECDNAGTGPANASRWNTGLRHGPPITQPDIWYSYNDNASPPQGTPCLAYYDGSGGTCPQLFPELGTGGVGPHGAAKYEFDPDNPSETKFPPYFDGAMFLGEFTRDYLREVRLDSHGQASRRSTTCSTAAPSGPTAGPFECDNPMDMQFGADGNFYLLTYGDGFFVANPDAGLYRFEYVAGDAEAEGGASTPRRPTGWRRSRSSSPARARAIRTRTTRSASQWDFDANGTVDSIDPEPVVHTYTANGVYTARLTVTDATRQVPTVETIQITVGNTAPTVTVTTPVDGDFFEWGDSIPYTVTVTDPQDGDDRLQPRRGHVRARA